MQIQKMGNGNHRSPMQLSLVPWTTFQRILTTTWRESTLSKKHELYRNQPCSKMQIFSERFSLLEAKVTDLIAGTEAQDLRQYCAKYGYVIDNNYNHKNE